MKYGICFALLLFAADLRGQNDVLAFRMGVGTYSMTTQKTLQGALLSASGLPLRAVQSFPAYFYYGGSFTFRVSPLASLGIDVEYGSTGGRLHYRDYSGFARIDQVLKCLRIGMTFQKQLNQSAQWPIYFTSHIFYVSTTEMLTSELSLGTDTQKETAEFKSANIAFREGLMLEHAVESFVFRANVAAEFEIHGDLKNSQGQILTTTFEKATAQWDGLRFSLGIGFLLSRSEEKTESKE